MQVKTKYKQTEVGLIPDDWSVRPLLKAVQLPSGQVDPRKAPYRSMILVAPDHIESCTGRLLARVSAAEQGAISGKFVFSPGNIIYSKIRPYLKKAIIADFEGLCSADMYPMAPADGMCAGYLLALLLGHRFSSFAESVSVRSGIPKINRTELSEYFIAVPPLPEQRAIATALSDVDALINSLDRLIGKKRDIKQATMQQLLTGESRLPGFSGEWELTTLGAIAPRIIGGGTPARGNPAYWGGSIPWATVKDFATFDPFCTQETVTEEGLKNSASNLIPAGTPVISTRMAIGKVVIYKVDVCINQDLKAFFLVKEVDSLYLFYWFQRNASHLDALSGGSTVKGISLPDLRKLPFSKPHIAEQRAIASAISDMDAEITALEQRRNKTNLLKQGMMQELLTGRTRLV